MMATLFFRPAARIELADVAAVIAQPHCGLAQCCTIAGCHQFPAVGYRAVLDHEGAVQIGFAKISSGLRRYAAFRSHCSEAQPRPVLRLHPRR